MKSTTLCSSTLKKPLSITVALLALIVQAKAFTLDLIGGGWAQETVTFEINASRAVSSAAIKEVLNAIEDWNNIVRRTGAPTLVAATGSGKPDLLIQMKVGGGSVLGQTSVRAANPFSCIFTSAKILLSGKAFGQDFSTAGIGNVTRHELGHVYGLGHSDDPDDLMYFEAAIGDIFGGIEEPISNCDIDGLTAIYSSLSDCSVPDGIECN